METAPKNSIPLLEKSMKAYGMIPNLHGALAESPATLDAYQKLQELLENSSFDAEELTVIWQSINVENSCHYCVPAHTGIAHMMNVDPSLTVALRNKRPMPTKKLQILQDTTLSIVRNRGCISDSELKAFYSMGYQQQQVLEIILGIAQKTISNYTNHIAHTPVDGVFQKFAWQPNMVWN
jgi:alkylhydroperoxidase family enzyme